MRRLLLLFVLILLAAGSANAQDAALSRLRNQLLPLRQKQAAVELRGATRAFDAIKHDLRDFVESRLQNLKPGESELLLADQINQQLRTNGLFCETPGVCQEQSSLGSIDPIKLQFQQDKSILLVKTTVGIQDCGGDDSAYLYQWDTRAWKRLWQSEQNDYRVDKYNPQSIQDVVISDDFDQTGRVSYHLVLTVGNFNWCTSNWHPVYFKLWQVTSSGSKLLLDKSELAFEPELIQGRVTPNEMLVEFRKGSVDHALHNYGAVRHYLFDGTEVKRTEPIALGPRSFVDEWLASPWNEAAAWSDKSQVSLEQWHKDYSGEFGDTFHCTTAPDLWQVSIEAYDAKVPPTYFLIRWQPPYRFMMVSVGTAVRAGCGEKDPEADKDRALFPARSDR